MKRRLTTEQHAKWRMSLCPLLNFVRMDIRSLSFEKSMLPKQATRSSLRSNLKITNCRNPYPGVFQGFRPTRIDPSRQVSMSAAHMGPSSSIWTRIWPKMSENIKNRPNISQLIYNFLLSPLKGLTKFSSFKTMGSFKQLAVSKHGLVDLPVGAKDPRWLPPLLLCFPCTLMVT